MSLALAGTVLGQQHPRFSHVPTHDSQHEGEGAIDCAQLADLLLDPWQKLVLLGGLATRAGRWAARECAACVPRQNGKGGIIEALELYWLFVLGERLVIHSAHLFDTSKEALFRLETLVRGVPEFHKRVARYSHSHGEEGIYLKDGSRIRFKTRTKGGGRGLTGDKVILDEAMYLPEEVMGALMPVMSARPDGQMWYFGSAVDQAVHDHGVTFARVRERGHAEDDAMAWFEWGVDASNPDDLAAETVYDRAAWAEANPAFGIRITDPAVMAEARTLARRTFAVERLGVGDWPRTDGAVASVIDLGVWDSLKDPHSKITGPLVLAFDVSPDRSRSTISACGRRADRLFHIETVDARKGSAWVPTRVAELAKKHKATVVCDGVAAGASLVDELDRLGVTVKEYTVPEHAEACGQFFDAVTEKKVKHLGQPELDSAVRGAAKRVLEDKWAWSRKNSTVDITPLVSATFAFRAAAAAKTYRTAGF